MNVPVQIVVRGFGLTPNIEAEIRTRVDKLEHVFERVISCHVVLELLAAHKHDGRHFRVNIDLRIPGEEIAVSHKHDTDVYVAIHEAFDAARRRLDDLHKARMAERHDRSPGRPDGPAGD